jgi:exopolysaccharide biosynthesis polyprenyl glycosylphosphotransferase
MGVTTGRPTATTALVAEDDLDARGAPRSPADPRRPGTREVKAGLVLTDLGAVVFAGCLSIALFRSALRDDAVIEDHLRLFLLSLPLWPPAFAHQRLYRARSITRGTDEAWRCTKAIAAGTLGTAVIASFAGIPVYRSWYPVLAVCMLMVVGAERLVVRMLFRRARRRGQLLREVVIIGRNAEGQLVKEMLDHAPEHGYRVVAFLEDLVGPGPGAPSFPALRDAAGAVDAVRAAGASGVIIAATAIDIGTSNRLIRALTEAGIHVELSSTLCDIAADRLTVRPLGRFPMVYIEPVRRDGWRSRAKRSFDLVGALVGLVVLAPVFGAAALAVRVSSPGPVLFRQVRVGTDGELFEIVKFRTMVDGAEGLIEQVRHLNESRGPLFKIREDPRVTRVGRVLRRMSIDELPQLLNVLRGQMSLVGPRPALPSEAARWDPMLRQRLRAKPGITGMWQVSGRSDATEDYGQLDLYYVDNWNLVADLVILARTVPAVLGRRGSW